MRRRTTVDLVLAGVTVCAATALAAVALRDVDLALRLRGLVVLGPAATLGAGVLARRHTTVALGCLLVAATVAAPLTTRPVDAVAVAWWAVALGLVVETALRATEATPPPAVDGGSRWQQLVPALAAAGVPLVAAPLLATVAAVDTEVPWVAVAGLGVVAAAVRLLAAYLGRRAAHPGGRHAHGDA